MKPTPGPPAPLPAGRRATRHRWVDPAHHLPTPNLKLAVIDALVQAGAIDLGTPQQLAEHVLGRPIDLRSEGDRLLQPVYDYLVRYPLTVTQLDSVEVLTFDGALGIYEYIWYLWDGESDEFDISSIDGIEHCRNLRRVNANALVSDDRLVLDLRRMLSIEAICRCLRHVATDLVSTWSDPELYMWLAHCFQIGQDLGLRSEIAYGRWAYLMLITEGRVADEAAVRSFITGSSGHPDEQVAALLESIAQNLHGRDPDDPASPSMPGPQPDPS